MIRTWLKLVLGLILAMVVLGGLTRLTHSGLSITDWRPIMGAIPPLSEAEWQAVFERYQATPEYRLKNFGMLLEQFKVIYLWEYFHRLLGRLIGVVYFFPFVWFWWKGMLVGPLKLKLAIGFGLGGLQGVVGWYMVQSGLVHNPDVSHYRLAIHLGLALFVLVYLYGIYLDIGISESGSQKNKNRTPDRFGAVLFVIVWIQVLWGAFTAGLHAGHMYNTFPKMLGQWIPTGLVTPGWINFLENPMSVQWFHRWLGTALVILTVVWWHRNRTVREVNVVAAITAFQFLLGISTLVFLVPVSLASLHQFMGAVLLMSWVAYFKNSRQTRATSRLQ